MTITLEGAGGLFTIFKRVVAALVSVNTAQGTTIPTAVDDLLSEVGDIDTVAGLPRASRLSDSVQNYKLQTNVQRELSQFMRELLIARVVADAPHVPADLGKCIDELIRQMNAAGIPETVERNVVSATVSSAPSGAPKLIVTDTDGDGRTLQRMLPETMVGRYLSPTSLLLESGAVVADKLSSTWPGGSGLRLTLNVEATGLLLNQSFDDVTVQANVPDSWIVTVGTVGTTLAVTVTEVQTITISGSPTSGFWRIKYTSSGGIEQWTSPLAHDASATDVQSALAELAGMATVIVTSTGTLPSNVVYTVAFHAVAPPGDIAALVATHNFDAGSIAVAQVTAGQAAYEHKAFGFLGDGAQLTALRQPLHGLGLSPSTCYALSLQLKTGSTGTTGTLVVELVDGTGTVITDDAGANNRLTVDISTLSPTAFAPATVVFRTPANLPDVFYLQLRLSVAINNTKALYLDDCLFSRMTELYRGGPWASLVANSRVLQSTDRYEVTIANNFAGAIQTYFGRMFDRQLPSAASGAETIPD